MTRQMIVSAFSGFEPEYLEDGQNTDGRGHGTMIADKKYRVFSITIMTALIILALLGIGNNIGNAEHAVPTAGRYEKQSDVQHDDGARTCGI